MLRSSAVSAARADPPTRSRHVQTVQHTSGSCHWLLMIIHGSTGADRAGGSLRVKEYLLESLQHLDTISEDSVGEEEGVEEVNGEEPEICQPLKQSLGSSVAYLWNLAVVEAPTKSRGENIFGLRDLLNYKYLIFKCFETLPDIYVIFEERGVTPYALGH